MLPINILPFIRDEVQSVSWKSRVIGFGHAELDIGDADRAEYR